jgi:MOSC domain-containing protein YiiM
MLQIGPYRFTKEDARNTIAAALTIIDQMSEGRSSILEPARLSLTSVLARDEPEISRTLDEVWAIVMSATPTLRAAGSIPRGAPGVVSSINVGSGGVPKTPVPSCDVDHSGIVRDTQVTRKHHGRPYQALSLWSAEVIETLNIEGHRLHPGAAGENITVSGLDWSSVRPGTRLSIGDVVCDVSSYAAPCKQLAHLFVDRDFGRIDHKRDLASGFATSRVYATVIEPGRIRNGDRAEFA